MMEEKITFESLCGKHILSGVELGVENIAGYGYTGVVLFTLDGVTYMLVENHANELIHYYEDIRISEIQPEFTFTGIEVICSMMEDDGYYDNDCILIRDSKNGKIIFSAGTRKHNENQWCVSFFSPEYMNCNEVK